MIDRVGDMIMAKMWMSMSTGCPPDVNRISVKTASRYPWEKGRTEKAGQDRDRNRREYPFEEAVNDGDG